MRATDQLPVGKLSGMDAAPTYRNQRKQGLPSRKMPVKAEAIAQATGEWSDDSGICVLTLWGGTPLACIRRDGRVAGSKAAEWIAKTTCGDGRRPRRRRRTATMCAPSRLPPRRKQSRNPGFWDISPMLHAAQDVGHADVERDNTTAGITRTKSISFPSGCRRSWFAQPCTDFGLE